MALLFISVDISSIVISVEHVLCCRAMWFCFPTDCSVRVRPTCCPTNVEVLTCHLIEFVFDEAVPDTFKVEPGY